MAILPVPKTWQFNVNQRLLSRATKLEYNQRQLLTIKNSMIGFALSPWTVRGSSNSVAAGFDGVDRWAANTNLVWAGAASARSWITLRQPGLGPSELTIDCVSAGSGDETVRFIWSPGGVFAGGTTTARPTAADEIDAGTDVGYGSTPFSNAAPNALHVAQSTDGQCTRIFSYRQGAANFMMCLEKIANPVTNFTLPYVVLRPATNGINTAGLNSVDCVFGRAPVGRFVGRLSAFGTRNRQLIQQLSYQESAECWPFSACGLWVTTTVGARGRHGIFQDLWLAPSGDFFPTKQDGDSYPGDTNLFAQVGAIIMPWGGQSAPRLAF